MQSSYEMGTKWQSSMNSSRHHDGGIFLKQSLASACKKRLNKIYVWLKQSEVYQHNVQGMVEIYICGIRGNVNTNH